MKYKALADLPAWTLPFFTPPFPGHGPSFVEAHDEYLAYHCGSCGFYWLNWRVEVDCGRRGTMVVNKYSKCPKCGSDTVTFPLPFISRRREGFD